MRTGEKIFLAACIFLSIAVAGAGYYLFIWEGDSPGEPVGIDGILSGETPPAWEGVDPSDPGTEAVTEIEGYDNEFAGESDPEDPAKTICTLSGRVLDTDKNPIPEVKVALFRSKHSGAFLFGNKQKPLLTGKTDNEGRFSFSPLYPGGGYRLLLENDLYAREILNNLTVKEQEETKLPTIVLTQGLTVYGKVRNNKGKPINGAKVAIIRTRGANIPDGHNYSVDRMAITDEQGAYSISHIDDSINDLNFVVRVTAEGHETKHDRFRITFDGKTRHEFNFILAKERFMKGRVTDTKSKPIAGARVKAIQLKAKERPTFQATTNEEGKFVLRCLSDAEYYVSVSHLEYTPASIAKAAAGREDLFFTMNERSGIAGQVVDMNERPVPSFWINVQRRSGSPAAETTRNVRRKFTHKEGRFIIKNLDPGKYDLEIIADRFAPFKSKPIKVVQEVYSSDLVFKISRGGSLSGVLYSHESKPLKGAYVHLRYNNYRPNPIENIFGSDNDIRTPVVRTDDEGRYSIETIAAGTYQLEFRHRGYPRMHVNDIQIKSEVNEEVPPQYMKVGAVLQGLVYNEANTTIASATVHAIKTDNTVNVTVSADMKGFYKFTNLTPGIYKVYPVRKLQKDKNPMSLIGSMLSSMVENIELREGEVKNLTLIIRSSSALKRENVLPAPKK